LVPEAAFPQLDVQFFTEETSVELAFFVMVTFAMSFVVGFVSFVMSVVLFVSVVFFVVLLFGQSWACKQTKTTEQSKRNSHKEPLFGHGQKSRK
jgi:uncharacterized membrane protein